MLIGLGVVTALVALVLILRARHRKKVREAREDAERERLSRMGDRTLPVEPGWSGRTGNTYKPRVPAKQYVDEEYQRRFQAETDGGLGGMVFLTHPMHVHDDPSPSHDSSSCDSSSSDSGSCDGGSSGSD